MSAFSPNINDRGTALDGRLHGVDTHERHTALLQGLRDELPGLQAGMARRAHSQHPARRGSRLTDLAHLRRCRTHAADLHAAGQAPIRSIHASTHEDSAAVPLQPASQKGSRSDGWLLAAKDAAAAAGASSQS